MNEGHFCLEVALLTDRQASLTRQLFDRCDTIRNRFELVLYSLAVALLISYFKPVVNIFF